MNASVISNGNLITDFNVEKVEGQPSKRRLVITHKQDQNSFGNKLVKIKINASDNTLIASKTISIFIEPVNDPPVARPLSRTYQKGDTKQAINASDILTNACSDVDTAQDDVIRLLSISMETGYESGKGSIGDVVTEGGYIKSFAYYPPDKYFDEPVKIKYVIQDSKGETATNVLTLAALPHNYAPIVKPINPENKDEPLKVTIYEDGKYELDFLFIDPETKREDLVLSIGSAKEDVINREGLQAAIFNGTDETPLSFTGGAHLTISPRANQYSETPFEVEIMISDRINTVSQKLLVTVLPIPDPPITPEQEVATRESTPVEFNLLTECLDHDPGDVLKLAGLQFVGGEDSDNQPVSASKLPGTITMNANGVCEFKPDEGFVGTLEFDYIVQDKFHGQNVEIGPSQTVVYNGQTTGKLIITVGSATTGPSLRRLQPVIAYAGQTLKPYDLETKNLLVSGQAYSISVSVSGGPVNPDSIKLDGLAPAAWNFSVPNGEPNPTHKLTFDLKSGFVGRSVVRFTIQSTDDQGNATSNSMSFTVTTHAENLPPTMRSHVEIPDSDAVPERTGSEYNNFLIDVLALAGATDPEDESIYFGTMSVNNTYDTVVMETDADGYSKVRYYVRHERNARNGEVQYATLTYTIFDNGGKIGEAVDENGDKLGSEGSRVHTGTIQIPIKVENHLPYSWNFFHIESAWQETITLGRTVWDPRAHDADGDKQYLESIGKTGNPAAVPYNASVSADGETLSFKPPEEGGWLTIPYRVYSYYWDNTANGKDVAGANQTNPETKGFSEIYIYVPPKTGGGSALIPPRAGGSWTRVDEDKSTAVERIEITGLMFGDGGAGRSANVAFTNPGMTPEFVTTGPNGNTQARIDRIIQNAKLVKEVVTAPVGGIGGEYRYFLEYELVKDGNTYIDDAGNLTINEKGIGMKFTIVNQKEVDNGTEAMAPTATGTYTLYVKPENDLPVLEDQDFAIKYKQDVSGHVVEKDAVIAVDNTSGKDVIRSSIQVEQGANNVNEISFKVTDPDYPTQSLCDHQVRIAISSSNDMAVAGNQVTLVAPTDGSGIWKARFSGYLVGSTELTICAFDESGGQSETVAVIEVEVTGTNHAPVAFDHYAVFLEDAQVSVKVAYQDAAGENSDIDEDPVKIVLVAGDSANSYGGFGNVRIQGDEIIFDPKLDYAHAASLALTQQLPGGGMKNVKPGDWLDNQQICIAYKLVEDVTGRTNLLKSEVKYLYIHINPVNDAPSFVGINKAQEAVEAKPGDSPQTITLTLKDTDSDLVAAFASNQGEFACHFAAGDSIFQSDAANILSVTKNADGTYAMVIEISPNPYKSHANDGYSTLTVKVVDGDGETTTGAVKVHVRDRNFAPKLKDGFADPIIITVDTKTRLEVNEDEAIRIPITEYFEDPDGDAIKIAELSDNQYGTIALDGNEVVFKGNSNYFTPKEATGTDGWGSFSVKLTDGTVSSSVKVCIYIKPVNDPPVTKDLSLTTQEDTDLEITSLFEGTYNSSAQVFDVDNEKIDLDIIAIGTGSKAAGVTTQLVTEKGGTLKLLPVAEGGNWKIIYQPAKDFAGVDAFYYTVQDKGNGDNLPHTKTQTSTGKITISVVGVDDSPRGNFEGTSNWSTVPPEEVLPEETVLWSLDEDTTKTYQFKAWDVENKPVTVATKVLALEGDAPTNCANLAQLFPDPGGIVPTGSGIDRTFTFKPNPDKYGKVKLAIELSDGAQKATYIIYVHVLPVNDAPTIQPGTVNMQEDTASAATTINASDKETAFANLQFALDGEKPAPTRGTVSFANGKFVYTPTADYFGPDEFWIKVTDLGAANTGVMDSSRAEKEKPLSASAKITVNIAPVNDAPAAPSDVALDKAQYKGGDPVIVTWQGGSDKFNETKAEHITYELAYSVNGGANFTNVSATPTYDSGNSCWTATLTGISTGKDTDNLVVRVQTKDDGKSYEHTGDSASGTVANTSGVLRSAWVNSSESRVDSKPPTMTFAQVPNSWTNGSIRIEIIPNVGNAPGGTNVAKVEWEKETGVWEVITAQSGKYYLTVTDNGSYKFRVTDLAGNEGTASETVIHIDRILPKAEIATDFVSGSTMHDAPFVTISANDSQTSTEHPTDGSSLVKKVEIALTGSDAQPEASAWKDHTVGTQITMTQKGTYYLHTRTTDNAGNIALQYFGPYVVVDAVPVPEEDKTITLYEHAFGTHKSEGEVQFSATDIDGDSLSYAIKDDAAYQLLKKYVDVSITASGGLVSLSHKGTDSSGEISTPVVLTIEISDGVNKADAKLTVTLVPVNDVPEAPEELTVTDGTKKDHYRANDVVSFQWTESEDEETPKSGMTYELQYRLGTGGIWTDLTTETGNGLTSANIPAGYNGAVYIKVRANDNNSRDVNPVTNGNDPAYSNYCDLNVDGKAYLLVDNVAPTATHTLVRSGDSQALITITAVDGTESWQSGLKEIRPPAGVDYHDGTDNQFMVDADQDYDFTLVDNAGNTATYTVRATAPANPVISYSQNPVRNGAAIAISWTHDQGNLTGVYYVLEYSTDGTTWQSVADNLTAKNYTFAVTDVPDTEDLQFRVRA